VSAAVGGAACLTHSRWAEWPVAPDWQPLVAHFFDSAEGAMLTKRLDARLADGAVVYPPEPLRALQLTPLAEVRVVIVGQDPYHGPGQAEGLSFSVADGMRVPPSLRNIHKELARDMGGLVNPTGSLVAWAKQGVLLLNTCLTVENGLPASHARFGWAGLTTRVLAACSERSPGAVFLLWGGHAQALRAHIDDARHLVLTANHPSPLSALRPPAPFMGCGHFGAANRWLASKGRKEIDWIGDGHKTVA
jgi:uracil-DNA glycosylase